MSEFSVLPQLAARSPAIVASERALLVARQSDYNSRKAGGAARVLDEAAKEKAMLEGF